MEDNQRFEMEDDQSQLGKVEISPEVIEVIASIAAMEVEGVTSMQGGFTTGVVEKISRRTQGRGVKVDLGEDGINIEVHLFMKYGVSIPEVGQTVQDNIIQTLRTMTALEVNNINIRVIGVQFDQTEDAAPYQAE